MMLVSCLLCSILLYSVSIWSVTASNSNTWVIIVNSSRYWFNYRHAANAAIVYHIVTQLSIPDDHIIFMNALDIANDNRNPDRGTVHYRGYTEEIWSMDEIEVDYTEDEVSADSLLNLLSGRLTNWSSLKPQLNSDVNSSILLYMAGHGGDEFFKFHDSQELTAQDLGHTLQEMYVKGRYKDILLIIDTCQASTMANYIKAPNIITLASSAKGENSYGYRTEQSLGVAIADRFTHSMGEFFRTNIKFSTDRSTHLRRSLSLYDLNAFFEPHILHSTPVVVSSNETPLDLRSVKLHHYFGGGNSTKQYPNGIEEPLPLAEEIRVGFGEDGISQAEKEREVHELFADCRLL